MDELSAQRREQLLLLLLSLLAGIIFDYLFYKKTLGISYLIYILLLLSLFWWGTRKVISVGKSPGWLVLIPVLFLSSTFAIYSNPVLGAINFILVPLMMAAHTLLITDNAAAWWEIGLIGDILKRAVPWTIENFPRPFRLVAQELRPQESGKSYETGKKILIGLLISVPILLVVIPLLSSADMVFSYYLGNLAKIGELIDFNSLIVHCLIIVPVLLCVFGYICSFFVKHPRSVVERAARQRSWDSTTLLTVLLVTNMVYLLFSVIQFSYLYGGTAQVHFAGFSYADYARQGFFELVAVTVINLSILLFSLKFVKEDNRVAYLVVRIFLSLLVLFSLNMLFSAHFKMSLYEQAYGLTYLRIFVHYFMALLLVFFLIALGSIWLRGVPVIRCYIVAALVFYAALNFINADRIIARYNVDLYARTGKIDVAYIKGLSYDALSAVIPLAKDKNEEIAGQVEQYLVNQQQYLTVEESWQSFNYSRHRAKSALEQYFKDHPQG